MGSGRGDRNQSPFVVVAEEDVLVLQWGPVVVTGIRDPIPVMTQIPCGLQWGPVVVTGISWSRGEAISKYPGFNGVRSW